jgi:copper resistance protein C
MKNALLSAALLAAASLSQPAQAHAFLDHALPAVGSTVSAAPSQVQLFFTQDLEPSFSDLSLADANGQSIATGSAVFDPQNKAEMVLNLPKLPPGHYKVSWHALSVDTHRTQGSFGFDVQP